MIDRTPVRRIAIIGAGTIGASFTAHFLARGLEVHVHDPAPDGEAKVRDFVARAWRDLRELGTAEAETPPAFAFHTAMADCVRTADFVQENAPETESLKIEVLAQIDAALPPGKIIASSTSALVMTRLAVKTKHPERCVLAHPFNPPHLIPLMELAGGEKTDPEAVGFARDFYAQHGLEPVVLKREIYGHIANRLQYVVWNEAVRMVLQGYCTPQDVDRAIAYGPGMRWALFGPFLSYALAGGEGGIRKTFDMFTARDLAQTDRAARMTLAPEQREEVIKGVDAIIAGRTTREIAAQRDVLLLEMLKARRAKGTIV